MQLAVAHAAADVQGAVGAQSEVTNNVESLAAAAAVVYSTVPAPGMTHLCVGVSSTHT